MFDFLHGAADGYNATALSIPGTSKLERKEENKLQAQEEKIKNLRAAREEALRRRTLSYNAGREIGQAALLHRLEQSELSE